MMDIGSESGKDKPTERAIPQNIQPTVLPTRCSTRIPKRPRRDTSPPLSPTKKLIANSTVKEAKSLTPESKCKTRRAWELWSSEDKCIFFSALNEHGKDFDAIQKLLSHRQKRKNETMQTKSKDQIRHFYYRTWNKISKYIENDKAVGKNILELFGLINYGEMRKRCNIKLDEKNGQKLNELVHKGSTVVKDKGKSYRMKTPLCKALKKLNKAKDSSMKVKQEFPDQICVELKPRNNDSWRYVQSMSQNPRLRIKVTSDRQLYTIFDFLHRKWRPHHVKLKEDLKLSEVEPPEKELRLFLASDTANSKYCVKSTHARPYLTLDKCIEDSSGSPSSRKNLKLMKKKNDENKSRKALLVDAPSLENSNSNDGTAFSSAISKPEGIFDHADQIEPSSYSLDNIISNNCVDATSEITSIHPMLSNINGTDDLCNGNSNDGMSTNLDGFNNDTEGIMLPVESEAPCDENGDSGVQDYELDVTSGWTRSTASNLSLFLLLPKQDAADKISLEYEWMDCVKPEEDSEANGVAQQSKDLANMLRRLIHLANTEFSSDHNKKMAKLVKPEKATPCTHCHCGGKRQTSPNHKQPPATAKSPSMRRQKKAPVAKETAPVNATVTVEVKNSERITESTEITSQTMEQLTEPMTNGTIQKTAPPKPEEGVFRVPQIPGVRPNIRMATVQEDRRFLQQMDTVNARPRLPNLCLPLRRGGRRNIRKPLIVQRSILPKNHVQARQIMTMAMFHGTQPAQTGSFMPIIAGTTPTGQATMVATPTGQATMVATPSVPGTVVATPSVPGTVLATPSVPGTVVATPTVIATPMECNPTEATITAVNGTTYSANLVNVNQNVLEQPQPDLQSTPCTITQPLYNASDTLYNASDTMEDQNTHVLQTTPTTQVIYKVSASQPITSTLPLVNQPIVPTNGILSDTITSRADVMNNDSSTSFSALLDLSLPGADTTYDINSSMSFSGLLDQSGSVRVINEDSLDLSCLSPSKALHQNIMEGGLTGGNEDLSLSQLLAESPMKRLMDGAALATLPGSVTFSENSRDSIMGRLDVDGSLQNLMNESSVDYMAKFADLAAEITATQDVDGANKDPQ